LQLLGSAQCLNGGVLPRQLAVAQKPVHAAVARLAQVNGIAVEATFFAGHQVVARGLLHLTLTKTAASFGKALSASSSFGSSLSCLATTQHEESGIFKLKAVHLTRHPALQVAKSHLTDRNYQLVIINS
jgi:hypothetical protein